MFLIQDGPRLQNTNDIQKISQCREIVDDVDWECEVFKNYSDENLGCGLRVYSGLSWAFKYVDRLAIIEDDCVPSLGFFEFTSDLLEKYKVDDRVGMVCGMNNLEFYDSTPYDYFFTTSGSIWGWATWKRVWDNMEYNLDYVQDGDAERLINNLYGQKYYKEGKDKLKSISQGVRLSSWSYQHGMNLFLNSQLNIVPKYNLITNIGMSENGANSVSSIKYMPKGLRSLYYMKTYTVTFPLKHPKYIINDIEFKKKLDRLMGNGYPLVKFYRLIESVTYRIIGGDFKSIFKGFKRRFSH
ncbi:hypothetical protein [Flavobacterium erciyesense]|nr:hypothetical protein [Flavobacterium erciyesense]